MSSSSDRRSKSSVVQRIMRWLNEQWMLILIYATFVLSAGPYLRDVIRYRGVESWPSVSAVLVREGSGRVVIPTQTRYGPSSSMTDIGFVEFDYTVDGKTYRGTKATPNGGGLPINPYLSPLRAFYKPGSPEVAVLVPIPYQGFGVSLVAAITGLIVVVHLWFTVPSLYFRVRYGRSYCRPMHQRSGAKSGEVEP
jgi:hypothetical protein